MTRRLDHTTRQSIAKKMREGVRPEVLAREYGVTVRTVYRCAQFMREIQIERGSRTETVVCRVSPADLALFDEKLKEAGVRNRSEALRNVIRNVGETRQTTVSVLLPRSICISRMNWAQR